jgi:hypothetical protein
MSAKQALETYFLDNRARLLEIASFLDRIDRYKDSSVAKNDFRYQSFTKAIELIITSEKDRTENLQLLFSDLSVGPIESAAGLKASGAWEGILREGN